MKALLDVAVAILLSALAPESAIRSAGPSATILGIVTLTDADGTTWAGDGARVVLTCEAIGTARTEVADDHGAFRFLNVPINSCSIEAEVQGFVAPSVAVVTAARQVVGIDLRLGTAPLRTGVNVGGTASSPSIVTFLSKRDD